MTARQIQQRLIVENYRQGLCCPNYSVVNWFEADVFKLTKAGYFIEYEIKMTRSDFKADSSKRTRDTRELVGVGRDMHWVPVIGRNKHDRLSQGDSQGPRQFYFVVPEGLIDVEEVPAWAGLIYAVENKHGHQPWQVRLNVLKNAPYLHKVKLDPKAEQHVRGIFYWRFSNLFLHGKQSGDPTSDINEKTSPYQAT